VDFATGDCIGGTNDLYSQLLRLATKHPGLAQFYIGYDFSFDFCTAMQD
jgi:hypothetical protein